MEWQKRLSELSEILTCLKKQQEKFFLTDKVAHSVISKLVGELELVSSSPTPKDASIRLLKFWVKSKLEELDSNNLEDLNKDEFLSIMSETYDGVYFGKE